MSPEDYSRWMVQAIIHLGSQLEAIRKAVEAQPRAVRAGDTLTQDLGDPLTAELERLDGEAMRLLDEQP